MKSIIANSNPILSDKIKKHFTSSDYYFIEDIDKLSIETLESISFSCIGFGVAP